MSSLSSSASPSLSQSQAWVVLRQHYQSIRHQRMLDWFNADPERFQRFSLEAAGILLDYSKNRINGVTRELLLAFADERQLVAAREALFAGECVNFTEHRPAMHMALRACNQHAMYAAGKNVMPEVWASLAQLAHWVELIRQQQYLGFDHQAIDTIVNIGIGGSDLGPQLGLSALDPYVNHSIQYHFLSTHDRYHVARLLAQLNPAKTLFIVATKSFATEETLVNAQLAREWLLTAAAGDVSAVQRHFMAVTAKPERAVEFGILPQNVLTFWDWVGGRYSIWSVVGCIIAIAVGMSAFEQFLAGAEAMDQHFQQAELACNMPVILALLDVWYGQFFAVSTRALLPYSQRLRRFPDYMQQLHMESLGKCVNRSGERVDYNTGNIIWGGVGTNSQHSFHQLLMQGTHLIPVDFILPVDEGALASGPNLVSHCLAQSQVLMQGLTSAQIEAQSLAHGVDPMAMAYLIPNQVIQGNVPSNTLLLPDLSPYRLGALIALYEHKVFSYAALLDINAFDQWGVERGKKIAQEINGALHDSQAISCYDSSTQGLLAWISHYQ